jgi:hypothetical protein
LQHVVQVHTAEACIRQHTSQHTSAYVSICEHTRAGTHVPRECTVSKEVESK